MHDCNSEQHYCLSNKALLRRVRLKVIMNPNQRLVMPPVNLRAINSLGSERLEKGLFKSSLAEDREIELHKGCQRKSARNDTETSQETRCKKEKHWFRTHRQIKVIAPISVVFLVVVPAGDGAKGCFADPLLELFLVHRASTAFDNVARIHDVVRVGAVVLWHPAVGGDSLCWHFHVGGHGLRWS